jgi:chromosome segregation ATPase
VYSDSINGRATEVRRVMRENRMMKALTADQDERFARLTRDEMAAMIVEYESQIEQLDRMLDEQGDRVRDLQNAEHQLRDSFEVVAARLEDISTYIRDARAFGHTDKLALIEGAVDAALGEVY